MADSAEPLALDAFQAQARTWIEENFPASLRGKAVLATGEAEEGGDGDRPGALARADRRQGLGDPDLAEGLRRRRSLPGRGARPVARDGPRGGLQSR